MRKKHPPSFYLRSGNGNQRENRPRRAGYHQHSSVEAKRCHGLSELCALPASEWLPQHRVRDRVARALQARDTDPRRASRDSTQFGNDARPETKTAFRRTAPESGDWALYRETAEALSFRRTFIESGCEATRADESRTAQSALRNPEHGRLRDSRSGRSHDDG